MGKLEKPRYRIVFEKYNSFHQCPLQWIMPMIRANYIAFIKPDGEVWSREFPGGYYQRGWPALTLEKG